VKTDDDRLVATNLPVLRWPTTIAAAANSSAFRIVVKEAATQTVHWDSGWAWRENPKQPNATTWPVSATTYAGPALAPSTKYAWSVEEKDPDASASSRTYRSSFTTAADLPTAVEEARRALHSTQRLYDGQLSNLLARVGADGYLSTSVYGGYTGLYTRDTSAFVLAMVQLGDNASLAAGGAALQYMLRTFGTPGLKDHTSDRVIVLDRAPHCTWAFDRHDAPPDFCPSFGRAGCVAGRNCSCFATGNWSTGQFHDQVDGTAHLLLAFDRWCAAAGAEGKRVAAKYWPLMKRFLST